MHCFVNAFVTPGVFVKLAFFYNHLCREAHIFLTNSFPENSNSRTLTVT